MRMGQKHKQCSVGGCKGQGVGPYNYYTRGFCHMHYERWRRNGDLAYHPVVAPAFVPQPCIIKGCGSLERYGKKGFCSRHAYRKKKYGDPLASVSHDHEKGLQAELAILQAFRRIGKRAVRTPGRGKGDLLVDGVMSIEIKSAEAQVSERAGTGWRFNIHRHGKLKETADYYIFQFLGVPEQKGALYAAFKAPLGVYTVSFSMRKMIRELAPAVKLYEELVGLRQS
jgi:hypothetical protein